MLCFQRAVIAVLCSVTATGYLCAEEAKRGTAAAARDALGVTHVAGKYHLTNRNFLEEGADQLQRLGVGVIKLYLNRPSREYPFNADWPETKTLVEVARTPAYRNVFSRPFSAYILTVYAVGRGDHYWIKGISDTQTADEAEQFYQLSRYLLSTYRDGRVRRPAQNSGDLHSWMPESSDVRSVMTSATRCPGVSDQERVGST